MAIIVESVGDSINAEDAVLINQKGRISQATHQPVLQEW
jgi:hypothetical protein